MKDRNESPSMSGGRGAARMAERRSGSRSTLGQSVNATTRRPLVPAVRRQWGSEKMRAPLPTMPKRATTTATWVGGFLIAITICAYIAYLWRAVVTQFLDFGYQGSWFLAQSIAYTILMSFLTFSALMYLVQRQGAMYRSREHARVPRAEIDTHFSAAEAGMTVLVPSYKEDPAVVRSTLLSAALQEFPGLRVVLLIDDPTNPTEPADIAGLKACRALPAEMNELLGVPFTRFSEALMLHEAENAAGLAASTENVRTLALHLRWAAEWLDEQAMGYPRSTTSEAFIADEVFAALAADFRMTADALFTSMDLNAQTPMDRLSQIYTRLVNTFAAQVSSFERKMFENLSHEANKAMNLNSYIGLMGGSYVSFDTPAGTMLRKSTATADTTISVPETQYILTLDADSVLLREYCLRLVHHMELPGNERIAVIQTPYSSFRGAPTRLERIAGATTDIQHILHQGMTYYDATFWVGANAVIRKRALDDIVEVSHVDGHEERRYIQDRTVIEDSESSIDLVAHGWSLFNYDERLSYSQTPKDFGSLTVQRARWANGGLLIIPNYLRYTRARRKAGTRVSRVSSMIRMNYLGSIAWASFGLVLLLAFPFDNKLLSPIIVLAALPYFSAMAYDLKSMGYKVLDVVRIYGFNLILLAVNLAGVLKSIQQMFSRAKIPFARTPKVKNRTATPALYVLFAVLIAVYSFFVLVKDIHTQNWANAIFAASNGILTTYAIIAFMGVGNSIVDIFLGMTNWIRVPDRNAAPSRSTGLINPSASQAENLWQTVLYQGPESGFEGASVPVTVTTAAAERRGDTRAHHREIVLVSSTTDQEGTDR